MKKIFIFALLMIALSVQFMAFAQDTKTETRNLSSFSAIAASGSFDIVLRKGSQESVEIKAKGADLADIITEVVDGTLKLRLKPGTYKYDIHMVVTYKDIKAIHSSGSSDIKTESTLEGDDFELKLSGSGDFEGKFEVKKLTVNLSGSADIEMSGKADTQEIRISGSGDVKASNLKGDVVSINISGSGDASLNAARELEAKISGSGSVTYTGKPEKVNAKTSGSGSIRSAN